jgi:hypothetical protein
MIPLDAPTLLQEVQAAEKERKKHWKNTVTLIRRYVGNYYKEGEAGKPVPENLIFSYIANLLPVLIFDNPEVTCTAKRVITHKPIASFMRMALNGWIKERHLRDELEAVCLDMLFFFGVMKVGIESRGDFSADPSRGVCERFTMDALTPYAIRLEPETFIIDAQAKGPDLGRARLLGHQFGRDIDDLASDERYDQEVVKRLSADIDEGKISPQPFKMSKDGEDLRRRVTLYELYLPEHRKICTIALNASGAGEFVRQPTDYTGPENGPYVLFGVYGVPNQVYPLSPIAAMAEQFAELNAHATAAATEAATHKKLVIVNSNNPELKGAVHTARSGGVVAVPNFSASELANIEIGGTSDTRLKYLMLLRERTDRISGQSDALRGKAQGVTASEAGIADANADQRIDFIDLKYREAVKRTLKAVGWYFFYDPAIVQTVSSTDPSTGQEQEGIFLGGIQQGQEDTHWLDFFLDIEPYSMKRIDPAVQRQQANELFALALQIAPAIVQFPWLNWRSILDDIGEANNIPDFANRVLNQQGLAMILGGVAMGQMPGQLPGLDPMMGPPQGLPGNINPTLAAGLQGAPVAGMKPSGGAQSPRRALSAPGGTTAASLNPGVAAGQSLGYFGGGAKAAA